MGDLLRVSTRIGYYVNAVWLPRAWADAVACSHHRGRWTVKGDQLSGNHWLADVDLRKVSDTAYLIRRVKPTGAFASADKERRCGGERRRAPER
jgi:hypothetical protein